MLSAYRGNSSAPTGATSNKPILVNLSGALPASQVFASPVAVAFADSPYTIASATSGTTAPCRTFLVDTSGGAVTVNFPATPIDGEVVCIKRTTTDGTALTIGRNGKNIEGAAADFSDANAALSQYMFQYDTGTGSWWWIA